MPLSAVNKKQTVKDFTFRLLSNYLQSFLINLEAVTTASASVAASASAVTASVAA